MRQSFEYRKAYIVTRKVGAGSIPVGGIFTVTDHNNWHESLTLIEPDGSTFMWLDKKRSFIESLLDHVEFRPWEPPALPAPPSAIFWLGAEGDIAA